MLANFTVLELFCLYNSNPLRQIKRVPLGFKLKLDINHKVLHGLHFILPTEQANRLVKHAKIKI